MSIRSGRQTAQTRIEGQQCLNFSSNDYLGLAADSRLTNAVTRGLHNEGWGSGASPLVSGRGEPHARLESALAEFEGTESALLFTSGFAANAGVIPALVGRGDCVFSDAKNHASIIDGCRLSGARVVVYEHCDVDDLSAKIGSEDAGRDSIRRKLIVTDGLFSMDGNIAPLDEIAKIATDSGAMLMVDEAHATGVLGDNGQGVCEHFGVEHAVSLRVGTLSKALGSQGGFACGERRLIDWLRNRARSYVFSTAAPAVSATAGLAALEIVRDEPHRRARLLQSATRLREALRSLGLDIGSSKTQIIPIRLGDPGRTMQATQQLRELGFLLPGIRPPTVPDGESLLRISLCYPHTEAMIGEMVEALECVLA